MIKDTKRVESVQSNAPKKGWKIHWSDGKFDHIFDESWLLIIEEAIQNNQPVYIEKEKKGDYWNIVKLELAQPTSDPVKELERQGAKEIKETVIDEKTRSMALSYAKDLVVAGKIDLKDITKYADAFVKYILGEVKAI